MRRGHLWTALGLSVISGVALATLEVDRSKAPSPPPETMVVIIEEGPCADVMVDGTVRLQDVCEGQLQVRAGRHEVVVTASGYEPFRREVDVPVGGRVDLVVALEPEPQDEDDEGGGDEGVELARRSR